MAKKKDETVCIVPNEALQIGGRMLAPNVEAEITAEEMAVLTASGFEKKFSVK